jgi:hypothetical protein
LQYTKSKNKNEEKITGAVTIHCITQEMQSIPIKLFSPYTQQRDYRARRRHIGLPVDAVLRSDQKKQLHFTFISIQLMIT